MLADFPKHSAAVPSRAARAYAIPATHRLDLDPAPMLLVVPHISPSTARVPLCPRILAPAHHPARDPRPVVIRRTVNHPLPARCSHAEFRNLVMARTPCSLHTRLRVRARLIEALEVD